MLARITVQSGIAAGTSHRIEGRVARVGSDPHSDVCLPTADVPGHALTLEFREQGCLVYNRCPDTVYIGERPVEPDHVAEWPEPDILRLGPETELMLDFELDSESAYVEDADDYQEAEAAFDENEDSEHDLADAQTAGTSASGSKTVVQLLVALACIVGCVLLLLRDQNRAAQPDTGPGFNVIISKALESSSVAPELVRRLQYAEAQEFAAERRLLTKRINPFATIWLPSSIQLLSPRKSQTRRYYSLFRLVLPTSILKAMNSEQRGPRRLDDSPRHSSCHRTAAID